MASRARQSAYFFPPDGNHHLIKIPSVRELTAGPLTKLRLNFAAHSDTIWNENHHAALRKQVFGVAKAERKPIIKPHRMRDDFCRKTMAFEVNMLGFGHVP